MTLLFIISVEVGLVLRLCERDFENVYKASNLIAVRIMTIFGRLQVMRYTLVYVYQLIEQAFLHRHG